jgi:hypothetical protein
MKGVERGGAERLSGRLRNRAGWVCALACLAALALAAGAGLFRGHAQAAFPLPAINPPGAKTAQTRTAGQQINQPTAATPEEARKRVITGECADLLKMATDLKSEVDKSSKDMLSVTVVRKAGEIEQLAHKVRVGTGKS